jgi:enoyl-CoA hydratase/carnithine racemase
MTAQYVLTKRQDEVLHVTINRPERLNALHAPAHVELAAVFDDFDSDTMLRVAIISGAGRAFCAGNDLKWQAEGGSMERPSSGFAGLTLRHDRRKPVIAAVNGIALGGGCEIVLAADLAVASDQARFALPEVLRGLVPLAGVHLLPRRVGLKAAMGMLLTGRDVAADAALRMGLVNEVVPAASLADVALSWAQSIVAASPQAVSACLGMLRQGLGFSDVSAAMTAPDPALERLRASSDFIEGPRSFAERRPPRWKQ